MSGKLAALTYSTYTVRHAVTLKWLSIVFVRLIQSQRHSYGYGKIRYGYSTTTYEFTVFRPTHYESSLYRLCMTVTVIIDE
jgi:hypothetical protein